MKLRQLCSLAVISAIIFGACDNTTITPVERVEPQLTNLTDSVCYVIGFQNGLQLANEGFVDVNANDYLAGFQAALAKEESRLEGTDLRALLTEFSMMLTEKIGAENKAEAAEFFEENRKREGVKETVSGLQYEIITEGTGPSPTPRDSVTVKYEGKLIDGTVFDGTYGAGPNGEDETATFLLGGVIPGWIEGLQLMLEGGTYILYIPSELAYGANPRPGGAIKPYDALIFKVELLEVR